MNAEHKLIDNSGNEFSSKQKEEAINENQKKIAQNLEKLDSLSKAADTELYRLKSIFPFDFFPDQIVIDINKVSVVVSDFFFSKRVNSIFLEDITDVFVHFSPFFATMEIVDKFFTKSTLKIKYLNKQEAAKARRIIQGLVIAHKENIELAGITEKDKLIEKLENIGESKSIS